MLPIPKHREFLKAPPSRQALSSKFESLLFNYSDFCVIFFLNRIPVFGGLNLLRLIPLLTFHYLPDVYLSLFRAHTMSSHTRFSMSTLSPVFLWSLCFGPLGAPPIKSPHFSILSV